MFWDFYGISEIFLRFLRFFGIFWHSFGIYLGFFGIFWNFLGFSGFFGIFYDIFGKVYNISLSDLLLNLNQDLGVKVNVQRIKGG